MRKAAQMKGIFCIEGLWENDLRTKATVRPLLEALRLNVGIKYIHRECATIEELEFYLKKWPHQSYNAYPVLYLALHGNKERIYPSSEPFSLQDISEVLEGKCANRVIMISSCKVLATNRKILKDFLSTTNSLAICGYRNYVWWMRSAAFELLLFEIMQENEFSLRGIDAMSRKIKELSRSFKDLDVIFLSQKDVD
jgi:hypothetical protein